MKLKRRDFFDWLENPGLISLIIIPAALIFVLLIILYFFFPGVCHANIAESEEYEASRETVRRSDRGPDVIFLQHILNQLDYYERAPGGRFDENTEQAVKEFQDDHGLRSDGVVGETTWLFLKRGDIPGVEPSPLYRRMAVEELEDLLRQQPPGDEISQESFELLAGVIDVKARGEPLRGKIAVGSVVLNRVEHEDFSNTIPRVIFAPGQFFPLHEDIGFFSPSPTSYLAARLAVSGYEPVEGALYFYNPQAAGEVPWAAEREVLGTIGNHKFLR